MGASSVGFAPTSDMLLAGYESGLLLLWDVTGRRILSEIQNVHAAPVMSVSSVSSDAVAAKGTSAMSTTAEGTNNTANQGGATTIFITADTSGTAHVHTMHRKRLLSKIYLSSRMLLDGRKGIIHSVVPLPPPQRENHPQMSADEATAALAPSEGSDDQSQDHTSVPKSDEEPVLVAIALTENILVVRFAPEPVSTLLKIKRPSGTDINCIVHVSWRRRHGSGALSLQPALVAAWGSYVEVIVVSGADPTIVRRTEVCTCAEPPRTVGWLDDRFVATICSTHGDVFEEVSPSGDAGTGEYEYRQLQSVRISEAPSASQAVLISSLASTSQRCFCHSSCASPGAAVFWQGMQNAVWRLSLRTWPQRIAQYKEEGRIGNALSAAVSVHWRRTRVLPGHWPPGEATAVVIQGLLQEYAHSIVNALDGGNAERLNPSYVKDAVSSLIEICVLLPSNLGILWDVVCPRFLSSTSSHRGDFLEVLAVYVSRGLLPQASPEAVQALVEHHVLCGQTTLVESCVVQLDIASLDFNQLMILCRRYNLFNVMIHLLAGGLHDYMTPAKELLQAVYSMLRRESGASGALESDAALVRSGGTLLVYLYQCVLGRRYPPGRGKIDAESTPGIRKELLRLLLAEEGDTVVGPTSAPEDDSGKGQQARSFPWLRLLLSLDPEGTFRILRACLAAQDAEDEQNICTTMLRLIDVEEDENNTNRFSGDLNERRQYGNARGGALVPALVMDIFIERGSVELTQKEIVKTMTSLAKFGNGLGVERMLEHLVCGADVVSLAKNGYVEHARTLAEAYQLPGVAIITATLAGRPDAKVQSLIEQSAGDAHAIFSVLRRALDWESKWSGGADSLAARRSSTQKVVELSSLGRSVISRVDTLISLDSSRTAKLILHAFGQDASFHVLRGLDSPELQFEYIRSVMTELGVNTFGEKNSLGGFDEKEGSGAFADMLARSGLEVTPELSELYIRLLCKFRPSSVLSFLQAQQVVFRPDVCVQYCEEAGVMDAAAKLYEDMGFDSKAIECLLTRLDPPLDEIEEAVRAGEELILPTRRGPGGQEHAPRPLQPLQPSSSASSSSRIPALLRQAARALDACISLSVRTGHRSASTDDATDNWFRVLERLVSRIHRLNTKSDLYAMYSLLMNDVLTAMMSDGQVPRDVVFGRLSQEFGGNSFGGFRGVLTGVLCAAEFEYVTYKTTRSILEADTYDKLRKLHSGRCRALPSSQIRIFASDKRRASPSPYALNHA